MIDYRFIHNNLDTLENSLPALSKNLSLGKSTWGWEKRVGEVEDKWQEGKKPYIDVYGGYSEKKVFETCQNVYEIRHLIKEKVWHLYEGKHT